MMPVPTHVPCWIPQYWGNRWIVPWWKFLKRDFSSVSRSQKTILGLAINIPRNGLFCVFCRGLWLFSMRLPLCQNSAHCCFYADFNKTCSNPIYADNIWSPPAEMLEVYLERNCFLFSLFLFSPAFFKSNFQVWTCREWANLISLLPSLRRTAEILFNTSISSLLQSVMIKITQGSHLHIYHSTYPQIISQLCRSWICKRDWSGILELKTMQTLI